MCRWVDSTAAPELRRANMAHRLMRNRLHAGIANPRCAYVKAENRRTRSSGAAALTRSASALSGFGGPIRRRTLVTGFASRSQDSRLLEPSVLLVFDELAGSISANDRAARALENDAGLAAKAAWL